MSHTYATVEQFKTTQWGSANPGTVYDGVILSMLEAVSRKVDGFCGRSPAYQSGFGPRTGTNTYDAQGWYGGYTLYRDNMVMDLEDDLLTVTQATVLDQTGGTASTIVNGTDFYLQPYNVSPKRVLVITGLGQSYIVPGLQILSIAGTWGYQQGTRPSTVTLGSAGSTATSLVASGSADFGTGATLSVGSEQMYVRAITGGTALTVDRGVNGTTAGTVAGSQAFSYYTYPSDVVTGTLAVAQRRWRMREAGLTGDFGGGDIPVAGFRDTERSILMAQVGYLRIVGIG